MHPEHDIVCGGFPLRRPRKSVGTLALDLGAPLGAAERVNLRIDQLQPPFGRAVSPRFVDLTEIAAYVYAADQAVKRQYQDTDDFGKLWRRHLSFYIPVRDYEFWQSAEVNAALCEVLQFLGDHFFSFKFVKATKPRPYQEYLTYATEEEKYLPAYDQIAMFSGGLDSLAGAIDALKREHLRMAFVTHIPTRKNAGILGILRSHLSSLCPEAPPLHIGIEVNKAKVLGREPTQRTRSFLFACLGATAAQVLGLSSLRFYENGVVSLNLPLCGQVIGARATRTTHPKVLAGFEKLFALVSNAPFRVVNPFLEKTKAEVIRVITGHGEHGLIRNSMSCAHTWEREAEQTHCGHCSQCLDRRLAMLAADAFEHDPAYLYKTNIFTASLPKEADRILVASYIERARTMKYLDSPESFLARFPDAWAALPYLDGAMPERAAKILFDVYKRHGADVDRAIAAICKMSFPEIYEHKLPSDCLVRIVTDGGGTACPPSPSTFNPVAESEYVFRQQDKVWEIRFGGGRRFLLSDHGTGCAYLHYLITNHGESFTAHQLQLAVFPTEEALGNGSNNGDAEGLEITSELASGGVTLDEKGKKDIQDHLAKIEEDLADATKLGDADDVERLTSDKQRIEQYLRSSLNKNGRARTIQDPTKRKNDAVSASFRRLIKAVREKDKVFADHLSERTILRHGSENRYCPPEPIDWTTDVG